VSGYCRVGMDDLKGVQVRHLHHAASESRKNGVRIVSSEDDTDCPVHSVRYRCKRASVHTGYVPKTLVARSSPHSCGAGCLPGP
jgi:hypothetical protein